MGDFGNWVDVNKTRKQFRCVFCNRMIPPGNKAHGYDGMWEGDWQNWRCCDMCAETILPDANTDEGISDEDFNYYIEEKGYYICEGGCKNNWGWGGTCSRKWSEDKQSMIFTCGKCGHVRTVDYPYENHNI